MSVAAASHSANAAMTAPGSSARSTDPASSGLRRSSLLPHLHRSATLVRQGNPSSQPVRDTERALGALYRYGFRHGMLVLSLPDMDDQAGALTSMRTRCAARPDVGRSSLIPGQEPLSAAWSGALMLSWRRMMAPNLAPGVDALRCHASPAAGAGLGECVIWDRQRRPGTAPLPGSRWPLSARTFSQPTATEIVVPWSRGTRT